MFILDHANTENFFYCLNVIVYVFVGRQCRHGTAKCKEFTSNSCQCFEIRTMDVMAANSMREGLFAGVDNNHVWGSATEEPTSSNIFFPTFVLFD